MDYFNLYTPICQLKLYIFLTQLKETAPAIQTTSIRQIPFLFLNTFPLFLPTTQNAYSLTPPSATPAIIYFDNAKYTTKIGITVITRPT